MKGSKLAKKAAGQGDTVWLDGARSLVLGKLIKSGGAGSVYLLPGSPAQVAKLYHPHLDSHTTGRKIDAMLALTPDLPDRLENGRRYVQIAWPQAAVHDNQGGFLGFVMPLLDMAHTAELEEVLLERQARAAGLPVGLGPKVTLAANLAGVLAALHQQRHYVVDLKPVNLRFYRDTLNIAMLDCDGFSIQGQGERYRAEQFTADYLAPEFQHKGMRAGAEPAQDRFALAVVIFQLLNFGIHPYSGQPAGRQVPTDIPARIRDGYYAYGIQRHKAIAPNVTSGHALMPAELRAFFDRAFTSNNPDRPSAGDWADLLRALALRGGAPGTSRIVVCKRNAEHQHFAGFGCAACAREQAIAAAATAAQKAQKQLQGQASRAQATRRTAVAQAQGARGALGLSKNSWAVIMTLLFFFLIGMVLYVAEPTPRASMTTGPAQSNNMAARDVLEWRDRSKTVTLPSDARASLRALDRAVAEQRDADLQQGLQQLHATQQENGRSDPSLARLRRTMMEVSVWAPAMKKGEADKFRDQLIAQPRDFMVASALGRMHLSAGEPLAATQYFEQAIWAQPTDGVAYLSLAAAAMRGNDSEQAARLGALGLLTAQRYPDTNEPDDGARRIERAVMMLAMSMPPEAKKDWQAVMGNARALAQRLASLPPLADRPASVAPDSLHAIAHNDGGAVQPASETRLTIVFNPAGVPQHISSSPAAPRQLNQAWLEQAKKWRYVPSISNGRLQPSSVEVLARYRDGNSSFSVVPAPVPAPASAP